METICNINPSSGTLAISGLLTVLALSPPHCKDGSKLQVHFSLLFLSSAEHWLRTSRTLSSSASCTLGCKSSTSPFQSHTQVYCDTSLCYVGRDDHLPHFFREDNRTPCPARPSWVCCGEGWHQIQKQTQLRPRQSRKSHQKQIMEKSISLPA